MRNISRLVICDESPDTTTGESEHVILESFNSRKQSDIVSHFDAKKAATSQ